MKKRLITAVFLISFMSFIVNSASAIELGDYIKLEKSSPEWKTILEFYLKGAGNAYLWGNIEMTQRKMKPLYCPPERLELGLENYKDLLEKQVQKIKEFGEKHPGTVKDLSKFPVEYLLLQGLIDTFPCDENKQ